MSGMLSAIPKTPLYDRLASEGRLDLADRPEFGTNVIPLQIGREELLEGYLRVLQELYDPEDFFARLMSKVPDRRLRQQYRNRLLRILKVHRRPGLMLFYVFHLVMHYHVFKLANDMSTRESQLVNSF